MKEQILEYLQGERDFDLGLVLLNKYGNRKALSKLIDSCISKGESEYNRNKMDYELIKLIGAPHKVVKEQKMRNYELVEDAGNPELTLTITGLASLPEGGLKVEPNVVSQDNDNRGDNPENSQGELTLTITGLDSLPEEGLIIEKLAPSENLAKISKKKK